MNYDLRTTNFELKRGFTLMELVVSIALLGIIMAAVTTLFMIGLKNYRLESQRNFMQKEINFTADDLGLQIKQASDAPLIFAEFVRAPNLLILALPAINSDGDFLYSGNELLKDHFIYYLKDGSLYKKIVPEMTSSREERENAILSNVSSFACLYNPQTETEIIECTINTEKKISNKNLNFSAVKGAHLRNHR